jgi:hypothetical protein
MGKNSITPDDLALRAHNLAALSELAFCGAQYYAAHFGTPLTECFMEAGIALRDALQQLAEDIGEIRAERSPKAVA